MKNTTTRNTSQKTSAKEEYNRREFMRLAGLTTLGLTASPLLLSECGKQAEPEKKIMESKNPGFPNHFKWGTATAAYQVEGAANEEGRGKSIWDTFSRLPGKIENDHNGDVACDFYHKYKDDIQLMKSLNTKTFRFSISWSRIFPDGAGAPNQKGLDFYKRLTDELLANGIEPFATLYHWDLPQKLQDKYKGWESRETVKAFADYTGFVAEKLSDKVKHFFTFNECRTFVELGYALGIFAPGVKLPPVQLNQLRHNVMLAHGMAVQAVRAKARKGTKVGPAENINIPVPISETPENIKAAEIAAREMNAAYMTVMMEGKYTDAFLKKEGANAPKFTDEELKIISSPIDITGINVYMPERYVRAADNEDGYQLIPYSKSHPKTTSFWHMIGPESIYWAVKYAGKLWKAPEIYITENGCSAMDELTPENTINDTDRIMFIRNYLTQLQRATSEGAPVSGYFYWSLLDNFEWTAGYNKRFGLYYVDYNTQKRIPKLSVDLFKAITSNNCVM